MQAEPATYKNKTIAAWLALVAGSIGWHRIYLHGPTDWIAWAHVPPTTMGLIGAHRMATFGQDDRLAWLLVPLLGLMLSQGMFCAIVYALTPDERWDANRNPGLPGRDTRWGPVLAAVASLLVGGAVLIGTIVFSIQKFFEWQLQAAASAPQQQPSQQG